MKSLRRIPIIIPSPSLKSNTIPFMSKWKEQWLSHWYSPSFRGRVSSADYARKHGVSVQAVGYLVRKGRLGEVTRDLEGGYWVLESQPYPAMTRRGGYGRGRTPDASVRALAYADFMQPNGGRPASDEELERYCKSRLTYPMMPWKPE